MFGGTVIGECIIDLALVDEERILFVATGLGDGRGFSTVKEDAAAEAPSWAPAGFPLFSGVGIDAYPEGSEKRPCGSSRDSALPRSRALNSGFLARLSQAWKMASRVPWAS